MKSTTAVLLAAVLPLISNLSTRASTLYGSSFGSEQTSTFWSLDQNSGVATGISLVSGMTELASDTRPGSFRIWGMSGFGHIVFQLDPALGNQSVIGFTSPDITALAFNAANGILYGTGGGRLYQIDPATAAATPVGNTGFSQLSCLGADLNGSLFGVTQSDNTLVRIDPTTGLGTAIGPTGNANIHDLAARPEDGVMFGLRGIPLPPDLNEPFSYSLFKIDTATGATTLVGIPQLFKIMDGLAFSPAVPEPSVVVLAAIMSTLVCLPRARSRGECRVAIMLLAAFAIVCSVSPVRASTLYGTLQPFPQVGSNFYSIDQNTGAATAIIGNAIAVDLASDWRPESSRMWGLLFGDQLYQIDPATGSQTLIGVMSQGFGGLAFDVKTGGLYGVGGGARGFFLYHIDPNTAAVTVVGDTTFRNYVGLGADLDGNLFGVTSDNNLIRINTTTGVGELVGKTAAEIEDLAVRPEDGAMFGTTNTFGSNTPPSYSLLRIDTATAAATSVGNLQVNKALYGLAFSPAVPEPSTLLLAALAAGLPRRSFRSSCRTRKA